MSNLVKKVVHCTEKWMFEEVLRWHEKQGNKWYNIDDPMKNLHYIDEYNDGIFVELCDRFMRGSINTYEGNNDFAILSFDQFKQQFMNKPNTKNERTVSISLSTAKEWYKQGGDLKKVALQAYNEYELKEKEVLTWDDYEHGNGKRIELTYNQRKSIEAYEKLLVLVESYNGCWNADWTNSEIEYTIDYSSTGLIKGTNSLIHSVLAFKSPELRDKFLANNEQLLKDYFMID